MTDKWLSALMGGDSRGRRGHGENSVAQHSPDCGDTASLRRRRRERRRDRTTNSCVQTKAKRSTCLKRLLFFFSPFLCKMHKNEFLSTDTVRTTPSKPKFSGDTSLSQVSIF